MAGLIFLGRPCIEDDDFVAASPLEQLVQADDVRSAAAGEFIADEALEACQPAFRNRPQRAAERDDGVISEAELARDAAAAFTSMDRNRDRRLTHDELADAATADFAAVDADGDGSITFDEVMRHKTQAFDRADSNGDGMLSYEEMSAAVAAR